MANDLPGGPFLPIDTLVVGHREHVEHHKVLHAWYNAWKGGGGGFGGGTSRVLARWSQPETVVPAYTTREAVDDDADIAAITFTIERPPRAGRHFLWDLTYRKASDPASIFASPPPPILSDTPNSDGLYTLVLDTAFPIAADGVLQGIISDGASVKNLAWKVLAAATAPTAP